MKGKKKKGGKRGGCYIVKFGARVVRYRSKKWAKRFAGKRKVHKGGC